MTSKIFVQPGSLINCLGVINGMNLNLAIWLHTWKFGFCSTRMWFIDFVLTKAFTHISGVYYFSWILSHLQYIVTLKMKPRSLKPVTSLLFLDFQVTAFCLWSIEWCDLMTQGKSEKNTLYYHQLRDVMSKNYNPRLMIKYLNFDHKDFMIKLMIRLRLWMMSGSWQ